eukprot:9500293-Pyramimonas_sp.AAC.1
MPPGDFKDQQLPHCPAPWATAPLPKPPRKRRAPLPARAPARFEGDMARPAPGVLREQRTGPGPADWPQSHIFIPS